MQPPQAAPPPRRYPKNAATQHLCAAAYIDRRFRDAVYDEVYARPDRAIAPNPGTDAVPVLRHIVKARTIDIAQQGILAVILLLLVCMFFMASFFLFFTLFIWAAIGLPVLLAEARSATPTGTLSANAVTRVNWVRVGLIAVATLVVLLIVTMYLQTRLSEMLFPDQYTGASAEPEADRAGSASAPVASSGTSSGNSSAQAVFVLCLLLIAATPAVCGGLRAHSLMSIPAELEPAGTSDRRTHFIGLAQHAPVVTYHSGRAPFVGSGFPLATWQLAMTLRPADMSAGGGTAMTIDSVGLNRNVKARIERLGADSPVTRRLPGLALSDHAYISGRDTAVPVFHPHELRRSGYPFATVEEIQADPTTPVRHYLRCTIDSWGGELITTVFLHCALQGETLYVEFTSCVLPPTPERCHVFGSGVSKEQAIFLGVVRGIAALPFELLRSPFDSIREIARSVSGTARGGTNVGAGDHGAVAGIRELGTDLHGQNYFQYRDSVKYVEILERQILDALLDYLRENNVDVSELDERTNAIVNNGVINYGKMQTGAAGAGSSAKVGSIGDQSRGSAG
ncbi:MULTISPECIES: hypothetical protein [Glycomyces]|uniref:Uncharacterized protein n=2 Tax=Glycomyces TaxID=58113 RepID=A0A9X3PM39_9ACTN|nr:hypothetical protein [Glycomyces lechevalierae]MDA1387760.1 hypothetical protein [Glycomyces lechevalierae]MDR7337392.1 hypothetical protein [Glycomyces lechevalierae]